MTWDRLEFYLERRTHTQWRAQNAQVQRLAHGDVWGMALRVSRGRRLGFAYGIPAGVDSFQQLLERALSLLELTKAGESDPLPEMLAQELPSAPAPRAGLLPTQQREFALALEQVALAAQPEIVGVRGAQYQHIQRERCLWNGQQAPLFDQQQRHVIELMAVSARGTEQESAWEQQQAVDPITLDPQTLARQCATEACARLGGRPVTTGNYPAVLERSVMATYLEILAPSFLGDSVQKNKSALRGRLGEVIYSPQVTLIDDGTREGSLTSGRFDGEGQLSQCHRVVEQGHLKKWLYDNSSAQIDETHSTGNSLRVQFKEMPRPGVRNFYLAPAEDSLLTLQNQMGNGILISDIIGAHTANPITGDFSVGASGYQIERGERVHPIKGFAIAGNFHDLLRTVDAVGNDLKFYDGVGAPSVLIPALQVGGL